MPKIKQIRIYKHLGVPMCKKLIWIIIYVQIESLGSCKLNDGLNSCKSRRRKLWPIILSWCDCDFTIIIKHLLLLNIIWRKIWCFHNIEIMILIRRNHDILRDDNLNDFVFQLSGAIYIWLTEYFGMYFSE